jgi:hypothetical protein
MNRTERIREILATYSIHGWRLECALLRSETRVELTEAESKLFAGALVRETPFDALWFVRGSHAGRQANELRLVAETPYALFETFEPNEAEEDREEVRREMEARMGEYAARS